MKVSSIIAFITIFLSLHLKAQEPQMSVMPDIPTSPQAQAFNRLGDYQINNNYGVPDISIPLYEVDFHGYKIPLTLHYEASPIRPGYNYDVIGLGWTMSGNSCVSRTIKDRADERGLYKHFTMDSFYDSSGEAREYIYCRDNGLLDKLNFQYDSYNIVLPSGRSIPFFMYMEGSQMKYHLMSQDSNVKISCNYSNMDSFVVTDESGVTYNFTLPEKVDNIFQDDVNANCNVTWLLTSIDIPTKGTIYYQYSQTPAIVHAYDLLCEPTLTISLNYS